MSDAAAAGLFGRLIDLSLLTMLVLVAYTMVRSRHLFVIVMLSGVYSLLSAALFVSLDAVDVAFTEAAVGAGVSTVLMLGAMLLTVRREKTARSGRAGVGVAVVALVGSALIYATSAMPPFGGAETPANSYIGAVYMERTATEIAVPNVVTAVLASYRGFDTLGETMVIFTAGLGVMLLLGAGSSKGGRRVTDPPRGEAGETDGAP
jgi:multicomponent Na+:H+ antiporter subunit B